MCVFLSSMLTSSETIYRRSQSCCSLPAASCSVKSNTTLDDACSDAACFDQTNSADSAASWQCNRCPARFDSRSLARRRSQNELTQFLVEFYYSWQGPCAGCCSPTAVEKTRGIYLSGDEEADPAGTSLLLLRFMLKSLVILSGC